MSFLTAQGNEVARSTSEPEPFVFAKTVEDLEVPISLKPRTKRVEDKLFRLPTQEYQFFSKYAQWREADKRRETWAEAGDRVISFFQDEIGADRLTPSEWLMLRDSLLSLDATPAMRILQMAGPALKRCNVGAYNCSYAPTDSLFSFAELLYILMQGSGGGFSVAREDVEKLPVILFQMPDAQDRKRTIIIPDTTEGWCEALHEGLKAWFGGLDVDFDYSQIRPAGTRLKTKGGRASGPEPLRQLLEFTRDAVLARQGKKLRTVDAHDINCMIGQIVQVGGVRRAAEISLFDADDQDMLHSKDWPGVDNNKHRYMANNCLPVGTLIHTERGAVPIESVTVGDVVVTSAGRGAVSANVSTGVKGTVILRHALGTLECTPEHRVAVFDTVTEWSFKAAKDVRLGDALVFDHNGYDGQETAMPTLQPWLKRRGREVTAPALDTESAWLIGLFQGDGNTSFSGTKGQPNCGRACIAFNRDMPGIADRIMAEFSRYGVLGKESVQTSNLGSCGVIRANSLGLALYMQKHVKQSHAPMHVPSWILQGTRKVRAGYLAGLIDSDGSTRDTGVEILSSVYLGFIREVQSVTTSLGIASRIAEADSGRNGSQPVHRLVVRGPETRRRLDAAVGGVSLRYALSPPPFPKVSHREFSYPMEVVKASGIKTTYMSGDRRPLAALRISHGINPSASPLMIESVEDSGRVIKTYDIEVEEIHQFTAEGIVVHNSAIYEKKPTWDRFQDMWQTLVQGGTGEPGIFNRYAALQSMPARRQKHLKIGTNPCGEILLRPNQFCNLSIVVARAWDTIETLAQKVRVATIFGTLQSCLTRFGYIRPVWAKNCNEERLLGVDITGQMDCDLLRPHNPERNSLLRHLKQVVLDTNVEFAARLGIPVSAAVTCVKPGGNSAQLFGCPSGIHGWPFEFLIRRFRAGRTDPLSLMMMAQGVPWQPVVGPGETKDNSSVICFEFPVKAPEGAFTTEHMNEMETLENWLTWKTEWAEHSVSQTIYVGADKWDEVGNWVFKNWDQVTGLSFYPKTDAKYELAPQEEVTREEYQILASSFPELDYSELKYYETDDTTTGSRDFACSGDKCEIL